MMGRFGSQTSTYNRLVTIFVAVGSLVSIMDFPSSRLISITLERNSLTQVSHRPTVTVPRLSLVPSASQDGIPTSIFPLMENPDMLLSPRRSCRQPMECLVLEELWDRYSSCGLVTSLAEKPTSNLALSSLSSVVRCRPVPTRSSKPPVW